MTVASALTSLNQDIQNARTAITNKGGTITTGGGSSQLATDIATIPTGGVTPTGTLAINENGTYNVTNYASAEVSVSSGSSSKYGANINTFLGDVNASGTVQTPTEQSDLVFTGVKNVADYGFYYKFAYSKVKSVSFPDLTTISGSSGCSSMLYGCTALTSASFPALTTISGSSGCSSMLRGCTALTDVYFPALTTSSFGSRINQFSNMLSSTGKNVTHTLHFPSNLESTISGLTGYPLFGGTSGYVVLSYDLDPTE